MRVTRREALAASLVPLAGCVDHVDRLTGTDDSAADTLPTDDPSVDGRTRIGFVGDLQMGRRVSEYHEDRSPEDVWGTMYDPLQSLDGLVANLECVISDRGEEWPEKTFHFRADPDWAPAALDVAGTTAVSLANNHAMDYKAPALIDTFDHLDSVDVAYTGAGTDLSAALEPAIVEIGDSTVAIVGFVDHWEPFGAGPDSPGTAYIEMSVDDADTQDRAIEALERAATHDPDIVVASLHWGPNFELTKSDHLRTFGRWLIDHGVDIVHGHSAHVFQGIEIYEGRPILYDTGDFVNDYGDHEYYRNNRTFLYELVVDDGLEELRLIPAKIEDHSVNLAHSEIVPWIHGKIRGLSAEFGTRLVDATDGTTLRVILDEE